MTRAELVAKLIEFPAETEVVIYDDEYSSYGTPSEIEPRSLVQDEGGNLIDAVWTGVDPKEGKTYLTIFF